MTSTRREMARHYGLDPAADWDAIYAAWKKDFAFRPCRLGCLALATAAAAGVLAISTGPIGIAAATAVFAGVFFVGRRISLVLWGLTMEDQYFSLLGRAPAILERARRDGIFDRAGNEKPRSSDRGS